MKIKPKEVFVNLPIVLTFDSEDEIHSFASNINTLIHGKVKMKYDNLGILGEKYVSIFYLQRNDEYHTLREDFRTMIENEEMQESNKELDSLDESLDFDDPIQDPWL